jgi:hypothetical protein
MGERDKDLVFVELQRLNQNQEKISDKIDLLIDKHHDLHIQLVRNTDSLIVHEKRTNLAEKRLKHVEEHITKINKMIDFFTPTKKKIIIILILLGLVSGTIDVSSKKSLIKDIISLIK